MAIIDAAESQRAVAIPSIDLKIEWYSGTGAGGQHRNKHQNCCRCIHEPTGIQANGTNSRSREDNRAAAYAVCRSRVQVHFHKDKERNLAGTERIRTYHEPDNRVTDHASGLIDTYTNVIIKGNIDAVVQARAQAVR